MDDITLEGSSIFDIRHVTRDLDKVFKVKDLEKLKILYWL